MLWLVQVGRRDGLYSPDIIRVNLANVGVAAP